MKWINEGGIYFPTDGALEFLDNPGPGIFQVVMSPNPMDKRLGLKRVSEKFEFDFKIYDVGVGDIGEKIKKVWNCPEYKKNLGVVLNGIKGGGKSVYAKLLCNDLKLPVILVDSDYEGAILQFVTNLNFECVILLDEAEKTFSENQEILLKLIDGVYNRTRKLYLLTTNTLQIEQNLIDRPGRIRYIQEFGNLSSRAIEECINDNLKELKYKDKIIGLVDRLEFSTIDILKNIIEEVNLLGPESIEDGLRNLNIPISKYIYEAADFIGLSEEDIPLIIETIETNLKHKCEGASEMTPQQFLKSFLKDEDGDWNSGCDIVGDELSGRINYVSDFSIKTSSPELTKGTKTDEGVILKVYDEYPGFFLILRSGWNNPQVCFLKDKKKPRSLFSVL